MNKYTFRLDVIDQVTEENTFTRIQECMKRFDRCCISYEIAEKTKKPHYQGIVYSDLKYETYKAYCNKFFPEWKGEGRGNGSSRSFAVVKQDTYEAYVCKQQDIRLLKGYTNDEIEKLKLEWKPKEVYFKKVVKSKTLDEQIIEAFSLEDELIEKLNKMVENKIHRDKVSIICRELAPWLTDHYRSLRKSFMIRVLAQKSMLILNHYFNDIWKGYMSLEVRLENYF